MTGWLQRQESPATDWEKVSSRKRKSHSKIMDAVFDKGMVEKMSRSALLKEVAKLSRLLRVHAKAASGVKEHNRRVVPEEETDIEEDDEDPSWSCKHRFIWKSGKRLRAHSYRHR